MLESIFNFIKKILQHRTPILKNIFERLRLSVFLCFLVRDAVAEEILICDNYLSENPRNLMHLKTDVKKQKSVLITENCHADLVLEVLVYLSRNVKFCLLIVRKRGIVFQI